MKLPLASTSYYTMLMLVINSVIALLDIPIICLSTPAITVEAGSTVTATIDNPDARPCEATITFSNPDFSPVQFEFEALTCPGSQQAEFTMPFEVPNGDASILWQCAGQVSPTCSHAWITHGREDPDLIVLDQYGTIGCLLPNATLTTLSTTTGSSTTMMDTLNSTYISTSLLSSSSPSLVSGAITSLLSSSVPGLTSPSLSVVSIASAMSSSSSLSRVSITTISFSSSLSSSITLTLSTVSAMTFLTLTQGLLL